MKKTIILACLSLLISSCGLDSTKTLNNQDKISSFNKIYQENVKKAKWTIMVYISGDNDLEDYVVKDIEKELAVIGSTADVEIIALADRNPKYDKSRGDWTDTKLFHVTKGMLADSKSAVAHWGERNMGDPNTLSEFVNWSKNTYPADHYALYMWGHGYNWRTGYTMEDQTSKDSLDPDEVKAIFNKIGFIDMVAYDGCNMASIEVDALWHGHATTIVHSQEYVEWDGIEYDTVIKKLNENPLLNSDQVAIITNKSASVNKEKTGSAIAVDARWDKFIKSFDEWSVALKDGLAKNRKIYDQAFKEGQSFYEAPDDKDLYDIASKINKYTTDPLIKSKSQALMSSFKNVLLDEWHTKDYANAHGMTISKLPVKDTSFKYYKSLDFSLNTHWDEFLEAYKN